MSAEAIIHSLLVAAAPVIALVPVASIYPGEIPQGVVFPALAVSHISSIELTTLDAAQLYGLLQSRIEVTVLTKEDYPTLKDLIRKVRQACNYQHGTIATYNVTSIVRELMGPDLRDSDLGVWSQTIDFIVTWRDPT